MLRTLFWKSNLAEMVVIEQVYALAIRFFFRGFDSKPQRQNVMSLMMDSYH